MWILRRLKIIAHFRSLEVIANFQGDRKLSYYEIKMKKWQFSVTNFWWWFEINEIEWDNCNTFEKNIRNCIFSSFMSHFLQLSVKLLVCRYYGAFRMLRTAIRTCKDVSLFVFPLVLYFLQWKFFLPKSVIFAFCFLSDSFYIDVEPKLMMPEAVTSACHLFVFTK